MKDIPILEDFSPRNENKEKGCEGDRKSHSALNLHFLAGWGWCSIGEKFCEFGGRGIRIGVLFFNIKMTKPMYTLNQGKRAESKKSN